MKPATYDFTVYQGSTFQRTFILNLDNVDFDLTKYDSIRMHIRSRPSSAVIWSSTESAGSLIKTADTITLKLSATETAAFNFAEAGYDIELVDDLAVDEVDKILRGTITLIKEYTK